MGASLSRVRNRKVTSSLLAALVVVATYIVYRRLRSNCPRVGDTPKANPVEKTGPPKSNDTGNPQKKKDHLKGPAPQKIDLFTETLTQPCPHNHGIAMTKERCRELFPRKFEAHGHVVVVRMNPGVTREAFQPVAQVFAEAFSPVDVDVVLLDQDGIAGELRRPKLETMYMKPRNEMAHLTQIPRTIIKRWKESHAKERPTDVVTCVSEDDLKALLTQYAQSETYTVHVENGVRYGFDVGKVMFCSGNTTERMHFAAVNAKHEVVVDMFVGIGYFTLPLAMHGGVSVVHALDKNPDSIAFVRLNSVNNRVDHLIRPQCGDNRVIGDELGGKCDRVLMGLIPTCKEFLPRALFFLKCNSAGKPVGIIHYHYLADRPVARKTVLDDVRSELGAEAMVGMKVTSLRCVKSYAPKRFHYVADLTFE